MMVSRSIYARAQKAVEEADHLVGHLLDIANIQEGSDVDRKVQAAMHDLFEALEEIPKTTRNASRIHDPGPLVFPVPGRDMRFWRTSDSRRASSLLTGRLASRVASAARVVPPPSLDRYRVLTASEYLAAFDEAMITDRSSDPAGYERSRVLA